MNGRLRPCRDLPAVPIEAAHHAPPFLSKSFGNPAGVAIPIAFKASVASACLAACQPDQHANAILGGALQLDLATWFDNVEPWIDDRVSPEFGSAPTGTKSGASEKSILSGGIV